MLRQLRSGRNMKTVMGLVAVSFVVGFVFLADGLNVGRSGATQSNVVAVINGLEISYEDFSRRVSELAESERARLNRDNLASADYERLEQQVWDGMVTEVLITQEAQKLGLQAADEEVVAYLTKNPPEHVRQRFTDNQGQFDQAAFERALADPNYPWLQDEMYVRAVLPTLKLRQMVYSRATVSESEVQEEFVRRTLRHTVKYCGRKWTEITLESAPDSTELMRYYQEHPERFSRGEQVVLEALRIDKKPSQADRERLLDEAQSMLRELATGTTRDFATLAEIYSEDPSASQGGTLGWTSQGALPPEVEAAAGNLAPGEHTDPVATERGVFVVQVDSVRTTAAGARELYLRQLFLKMEPSTDTLDSLRALGSEVARAARDNFEAAARHFGLGVDRLQPFENTGILPGLGYSLRVRDWVAQAKPKDVGGPFGGDAWILVLRVVERLPPGPQPFEEVQGRVRALLEEERKKEAARRSTQAVVDAIRAGSRLEEAAALQGLEVKSPPPFTYYEGTPDAGSANEFTAVAAALAAGQTSGVVETSLGAFVIQVVTRDPFDAAKYASERASIHGSLVSRRATSIYEAWLKELRERAQIEDRRLQSA